MKNYSRAKYSYGHGAYDDQLNLFLFFLNIANIELQACFGYLT